MACHAALPLLLGCDKTMTKTVPSSISRIHPVLCSGNHTFLLTRCTPEKMEGKHTEVSLSSFLCLVLCISQRTPLAVTRKALNLLTCRLRKTVSCQYLRLVNQQVNQLRLLEAAGLCTVIFFL